MKITKHTVRKVLIRYIYIPPLPGLHNDAIHPSFVLGSPHALKQKTKRNERGEAGILSMVEFENKPQDVHSRLVLQVYRDSNTLELSDTRIGKMFVRVHL